MELSTDYQKFGLKIKHRLSTDYQKSENSQLVTFLLRCLYTILSVATVIQVATFIRKCDGCVLEVVDIL